MMKWWSEHIQDAAAGNSVAVSYQGEWEKTSYQYDKQLANTAQTGF